VFIESISTDHKETLKRRERVSRSLASLTRKESTYAQEHRLLLDYLDRVLALQNAALEHNS